MFTDGKCHAHSRSWLECQTCWEQHQQQQNARWVAKQNEIAKAYPVAEVPAMTELDMLLGHIVRIID